jgi:hypothetical protein
VNRRLNVKVAGMDDAVRSCVELLYEVDRLK